jgi:hypothetical protein
MSKSGNFQLCSLRSVYDRMLTPRFADNTGLKGAWSLLPIHLIIFELSAYAVEKIRPYLKPGPILPTHEPRQQNAVATGHDGFQQAHLRVNTSSNAVN